LSATSLEEEIVKACDNVEKTLAEAGASWRDVVTIRSYHVPTADDSIGDDHMSVMVDQFRKRLDESRPVWTAVGVKALAPPDQHVEIEVVAIVGSGNKTLKGSS
jgi:enamine deaminase RidA (YjgF/YER057c/UK114 family)